MRRAEPAPGRAGCRATAGWPPCAAERRPRPRSGGASVATSTARTVPTTTRHPHQHSPPGQPPFIGIVGAGAVGTALGVALSRAGWPVAAVASRDPARRERFRRLVAGTRAFAEATAILDEVELVILAVPDDALPGSPAGSGCTAARRSSTRAASWARRSSPRPWPPGRRSARSIRSSPSPTPSGPWPPSTARPSRSRATTSSSACWPRWPRRSAATAVRLAPGAKSAYHAAAVLAAGASIALLDAIAELGRVAGLDEAGALAIYGPLDRADPGQRPGARHPGRPDRADRPRRRRHAAAPTSPRSRPTPRTSSTCTGRRPSARSPSPKSVARWHRRLPPAFAPPCNAGLSTVRLRPMQHSIAAKYAARPAARFVRPSPRARERRLGLRARSSFQAAPSRATVLRRSDLGAVVRLRASWRAISRRARAPGPDRPHPAGRHVPLDAPRSPIRRDRPSAASAPWLA